MLEEFDAEDTEEVYNFIEDEMADNDEFIEAELVWECGYGDSKTRSKTGIIHFMAISGSELVMFITPSDILYVPIHRVYEIHPKE